MKLGGCVAWMATGQDVVSLIHIDARGQVSMNTPAGPFTAPDVSVDIRQTAG